MSRDNSVVTWGGDGEKSRVYVMCDRGTLFWLEFESVTCMLKLLILFRGFGLEGGRVI